MKLKLPAIWNQRDSRWAPILLGYNTQSQYTIGMYGCLISCLGMQINKQPDEVNQILKDNNGFTAGSGNFIWSKCTVLGLTQTYVSPKWSGPVTSQGIINAKSYLDQGYPLHCEVDFNPATTGEEMHFVNCIGYDGDNFIIADPWTGNVISFDVYGGFQRAVIQFRVYDKKFPQVSDKPQVTLDGDKFEELVTKSTIFDELLKIFNWSFNRDIIISDANKFVKYEDLIRQKDEAIQTANDQVRELEVKLSELQENNKLLVSDNEKLKLDNLVTINTISKQQQLIDSQTLNIKDLSDDLETLKKQITAPVIKGWKAKLISILKIISG